MSSIVARMTTFPVLSVAFKFACEAWLSGDTLRRNRYCDLIVAEESDLSGDFCNCWSSRTLNINNATSQVWTLNSHDFESARNMYSAFGLAVKTVQDGAISMTTFHTHAAETASTLRRGTIAGADNIAGILDEIYRDSQLAFPELLIFETEFTNVYKRLHLNLLRIQRKMRNARPDKTGQIPMQAQCEITQEVSRAFQVLERDLHERIDRTGATMHEVSCLLDSLGRLQGAVMKAMKDIDRSSKSPEPGAPTRRLEHLFHWFHKKANVKVQATEEYETHASELRFIMNNLAIGLRQTESVLAALVQIGLIGTELRTLSSFYPDGEFCFRPSNIEALNADFGSFVDTIFFSTLDLAKEALQQRSETPSRIDAA